MTISSRNQLVAGQREAVDEGFSFTRALPALTAAGRALLFLTVFTPAVLIPRFFFPYVTTRNVFFRLCVEFALIAWLAVWAARPGKMNTNADPILKAFGAYLLAISLAALLGLSAWHSMFGDFERMGGVWAWLHLFLFYFLLRALMREGDWILLFRAVLAVADVVVIWGAFEFLPVRHRNPLFQESLSAGSTLGNPGLLGPYVLLTFALACWLLTLRGKLRWRIFAGLSALIMLVGVAGSLNRSSQLGLLIGTAVGIAVFFGLHTERRRFVKVWMPVGAIGGLLIVLGAIAIASRAPETASHFGGKWKATLASPIDYSRTIEWNIAIKGFLDRPVFGYGPENHQIISSHHFDPRIYEVLGNGIFDRTHNAWLESLATSGIVGTAAMLSIWIAAMMTLQRGVRENKISPAEAAIFSGALVAYSVYLTFWFFDIHSVMLWVAILAFLAFRVRGRAEVTTPEPSPVHVRRARLLSGAITVTLLLAAYLHGIVPLRTAHDLSAALEEGYFATRLDAFQRVMNSSAPQTLHTFPLYYRFLRQSRSSFSYLQRNSMLAREFDLAFKRGMIESERSVSRNSEDDRSYLDAARFSLLAGLFYQDPRFFIRARNELLHAVRISPTRPDSRIVLSTTYLTLRDSAKALAQLDSAMRLAPQYGGSFYYAAKLALDRKQVDSAATLLMTGLDRKFVGNERDYTSVISALETDGESRRAAALARKYLEGSYGRMADWGKGKPPTVPHLSPASDSLANRLPLIYLEAGQPDLAVRAALAFAIVHPGATALALSFVTDVKFGRGAEWKGREFISPPKQKMPEVETPRIRTG